MKKPNIKFAAPELQTLQFALGLFPKLHLASTPVKNEMNQQLAISAAIKLGQPKPDLLSNEWRVIYASLQAVQLIVQGELTVDPALKAECIPHMFAVRALVGKLPPLM